VGDPAAAMVMAQLPHEAARFALGGPLGRIADNLVRCSNLRLSAGSRSSLIGGEPIDRFGPLASPIGNRRVAGHTNVLQLNPESVVSW